MVKRSIRIKEFKPNIEKIHIPSDEYLKKSPTLNPKQAYFHRTDKNGFTASHLFVEGENSYNVVIIGDSFIENIFVDESKRICSLIEQKFLESGKKIKILNAGVSGATGLNLLNTVLNKIVFLKPDLIIFVQPCCDFSALQYKDGYFNDSKLFSNLLPSNNSEKPYFETIEDNAYQIFNNITVLSKICEINKIKLCIATCCSISSKRQLKMMNDIIRNNSKNGYDILDLDYLIPRSEEYFYDKAHLNSNGSDLLSEIIYQYIDKNINYLKEIINFNSQKIEFQRNVINDSINQSNKVTIKNSNNLSLSLKIKNFNVKKEKDQLSVLIKIYYSLNDKNDYITKEYCLNFLYGYELEKSLPIEIPNGAEFLYFEISTPHYLGKEETILIYFFLNSINNFK